MAEVYWGDARPLSRPKRGTPRTRFRFVGRYPSPYGDRYVWHARMPGESRVLQVSSLVNTFWMTP
jgi:hypothetical protein